MFFEKCVRIYNSINKIEDKKRMAKKKRNTSKKAWIVRIAAIVLLIIG